MFAMIDTSPETIIHDGLSVGQVHYLASGGVPGQEGTTGGMHRGLMPRDYTTHPEGYLACAPKFSAVDIPLVPDSELAARCSDLISTKGALSDIRLAADNGQPFDALDQNGQGYCWAYSTTGAIMVLRAVANQPYKRLSAHAIGCMVKNFRDEGGWGALSLEFAMAKGVPTVQYWAEKSMSRSNDKPETWVDAAKNKPVEAWVDLNQAAYDRKLTYQQVSTLLVSRNPVVGDFNWWGHSVCLLDLVNGNNYRTITRMALTGKLASTWEFEAVWGINNPDTRGFGVRILNSWGNSWSDRGMGLLTGSKAVPDGAVAPRAITPSANL